MYRLATVHLLIQAGGVATYRDEGRRRCRSDDEAHGTPPRTAKHQYHVAAHLPETSRLPVRYAGCLRRGNDTVGVSHSVGVAPKRRTCRTTSPGVFGPRAVATASGWQGKRTRYYELQSAAAVPSIFRGMQTHEIHVSMGQRDANEPRGTFRRAGLALVRGRNGSSVARSHKPVRAPWRGSARAGPQQALWRRGMPPTRDRRSSPTSKGVMPRRHSVVPPKPTCR